MKTWYASRNCLGLDPLECFRLETLNGTFQQLALDLVYCALIKRCCYTSLKSMYDDLLNFAIRKSLIYYERLY